MATQIPFWRLGEKYFPKRTESGQNKQFGLGVHTALKESHLSQGKWSFFLTEKGRKGGKEKFSLKKSGEIEIAKKE